MISSTRKVRPGRKSGDTPSRVDQNPIGRSPGPPPVLCHRSPDGPPNVPIVAPLVVGPPSGPIRAPPNGPLIVSTASLDPISSKSILNNEPHEPRHVSGRQHNEPRHVAG